MIECEQSARTRILQSCSKHPSFALANDLTADGATHVISRPGRVSTVFCLSHGLTLSEFGIP